MNKPDLQVYVKDFGENKGDLCLVAQVADEIVGAVWVRIMNDYGHIDLSLIHISRMHLSIVSEAIRTLLRE